MRRTPAGHPVASPCSASPSVSCASRPPRPVPPVVVRARPRRRSAPRRSASRCGRSAFMSNVPERARSARPRRPHRHPHQSRRRRLRSPPGPRRRPSPPNPGVASNPPAPVSTSLAAVASWRPGAPRWRPVASPTRRTRSVRPARTRPAGAPRRRCAVRPRPRPAAWPRKRPIAAPRRRPRPAWRSPLSRKTLRSRKRRKPLPVPRPARKVPRSSPSRSRSSSHGPRPPRRSVPLKRRRARIPCGIATSSSCPRPTMKRSRAPPRRVAACDARSASASPSYRISMASSVPP